MDFSRLPLLWRVFAINVGLLLTGTLVLVVARGRTGASIAVIETLDLAVGLVIMLAANLLLLRPTRSPIERLVERERRSEQQEVRCEHDDEPNGEVQRLDHCDRSTRTAAGDHEHERSDQQQPGVDRKSV